VLDHLGIQLRSLGASTAFDDVVLAVLGSRRMLDFGEAVGHGSTKPDFWLGNNGEAVCHAPE
jgi:hypothetical protein